MEELKFDNNEINSILNTAIDKLTLRDLIPISKVLNNECKIITYSNEQIVKLDKNTVSISVSSEQLINLSNYGINYKTMFINAFVNETISTIYKKFSRILENISNVNYFKQFTLFDKIIYKFFKLFGKEYKKIIKVKNSGQLINLIKNKINKLSNCNLNDKYFIVCSGYISSILQDNPYFLPIYNKIETNLNQIHKFGEIKGICVYIDPYKSFDDTTIYICKQQLDFSKSNLSFLFNENDSKIDFVNNCGYSSNLLLFTHYNNFYVCKPAINDFNKIIVKVN